MVQFSVHTVTNQIVRPICVIVVVVVVVVSPCRNVLVSSCRCRAVQFSIRVGDESDRLSWVRPVDRL